MGSEFQNIFKRGTTAWAVKYFKEEILTGLVEDLQEKTITGIDDLVCREIRAALAEAISSIKVKDVSLFRKNFRERLSDFLDIYTQWNDQRTSENRLVYLEKMRHRKLEIFTDFYEYVDRLAKSKETSPKRKEEYLKLMSREKEINDNLAKALFGFVKRNPDFTILTKRLETFSKRNSRSNNE